MPGLKIVVDRVLDAPDDPAGRTIVAERWTSERRSMWEERFERLSDLLTETEAISL